MNVLLGAVLTSLGLTLPIAVLVASLAGVDLVLAQGPAVLAVVAASLALAVCSLTTRRPAVTGVAHLALGAVSVLALLTTS